LLRVLAGIYEPDSGLVDVHGRISPMFDIGLGIDMELSGYDNIKLRSLLLGVPPAQIEEYTAGIAEFSQLGEYLELPVRTYSSGMIARLTFAIATCFRPEVLLMDEWIVAGDAAFMTRAERRLSSFVGNASILVLASHSAEICRRWCDKAVWLDNGRIKATGKVSDILSAYEDAVADTTQN
jgi:ABC-type polysaccharide/polyol phosphate transport system ATPase subunit